MAKFLDNRDRQWTITIDVDAIRRVRADPGVDLMGVLDGPLLSKIGSDPVLLVDVLWTLCAEQAEAAKVTPRQFGQGLTGDAIEAAATALLEGLADFFPSRRRAILRMVLQRAEAMDAENLTAIEKKLAAGGLSEKAAAGPAHKLVGGPPAASPPAEPPGDTSRSSPESSA